MEHFFARHLLEILRGDVLGAEQIATGKIGGSRETRRSPSPTSSGSRGSAAVSRPRTSAPSPGGSRRSRPTRIEPGVRIVKTIGDAVMLSAADPKSLLASVLALSRGDRRRGRGVPAGALPASRSGRPSSATPTSTATASTWPAASPASPGPAPSSTTEEVREAAEDGFRWSFAGERKVKGVGEIRLFRARRAEDGD